MEDSNRQGTLSQVSYLNDSTVIPLINSGVIAENQNNQNLQRETLCHGYNETNEEISQHLVEWMQHNRYMFYGRDLRREILRSLVDQALFGDSRNLGLVANKLETKHNDMEHVEGTLYSDVLRFDHLLDYRVGKVMHTQVVWWFVESYITPKVIWCMALNYQPHKHMHVEHIQEVVNHEWLSASIILWIQVFSSKKQY